MKRVSRACQQCRSKHIKCNGRSPCSRCIAHAELHNISPTEICLYPEPKKRGRPSAGTSAHTAHHSHHTSHNSSSVAKKKLNSISRVRVLPSSTSTITRSQTSSAITSPTPNVINLQQQPRWQKTPLPESAVYYNNGNEAIQVPYIIPQQITLQQIPDFINQHSNFISYNNDFGYTSHQQQKVYTINAPSHTASTLIPSNLQSTFVSSNNSNTCYRRVNPNNNNSNNTRYTSNNNSSNSTTSAHQNANLSSSNTNNTANRDNIYHSPPSPYYHLNKPYLPYHNNYLAPSTVSYNNATQPNASHFCDSTYSNNANNNNCNFSNEGSISDSSDSPDSSLTSTPELQPTSNANVPSITNSPLLNLSDYNPYMYEVNNNTLNIGQQDYILSYQEELDSPLLSAAKSEIAYVSSIAPNCIYPSMLERNNTTTYVKSEENRFFCESIPINNWLS